jgi:hypothetical protein
LQTTPLAHHFRSARPEVMHEVAAMLARPVAFCSPGLRAATGIAFHLESHRLSPVANRSHTAGIFVCINASMAGNTKVENRTDY